MRSDPNVMNISTGKNTIPLNSDTTRFALWCYGTRFIPTGLILLACHGLLIAHQMSACAIITSSSPEEDGEKADENNSTLVGWANCSDPREVASIVLAPQVFNFSATFVFFAVVSLSFLSRSHQLWQRHPGKAWTFSFLWLLSPGL